MGATEMTFKSDDCKTWGDLIAIEATDGRIRDYVRKQYKTLNEVKVAKDAPLADISVKDELCLMDIATFSLSRNPDLNNLVIQHKLKDANVTISGNAQYGIATIYDYDIVLYMVSHLAKEMNRVKKVVEKAKEEGKAINPRLPSRYFEPDISTLLKFCDRAGGSAQSDRIVQALNRLLGTTINIQSSGDGYRRTGGFSYISEFQVVEKTDSGKAKKVRIGIPNWIYDGIVRIDTPKILSMNRQYFELTDGIHRFLMRFARKVAGFGGSTKVSVKEIHSRSGSVQEYKYFNRDLKKSLLKLQKDPFNDFSIKYISEGRGKNFLIFQKKIAKLSGPPVIELTGKLREEAQSIAMDMDISFLHKEWCSWVERKGLRFKYPGKAFVKFCATKQAQFSKL